MKGFEFSLDTCLKMAKAAEEAQKEIGVSITMAIADDCGNLKYFFRFGDAMLPSIELSQSKAYSSAVMSMSTSELGIIARYDGPAFGINVTCPKLVLFGGGVPLQVDGKTVGGIGISGATADEDEVIAKQVAEVFRKASGQL